MEEKNIWSYCPWSYYGLRIYINDVWRSILKKNSVTDTDRMTAPLEWWINTGRATLPECKALVKKKPFVIGRILAAHDMESYDIIINAIKEKISK